MNRDRLLTRKKTSAGETILIDERMLTGERILKSQIKLCSIVMFIVTSLIACSSTSLHHTAPSRSLSIYVNNNSTGPSIKTVSAETYRVCDIGGCTNSVTQKTLIRKREGPTHTQKTKLAKLQPPIVLTSNKRLKSTAYAKRIKRKSHKVLLTRNKQPSSLRLVKHNHTTVNSKKPRRDSQKLVTRPALIKSSPKPTLPKMPRIISKNIVGIRFKSGQSRLSHQEKRTLKSLLSRIKKSKKVYIAGYLDNSKRLSTSQNKLLASKRAIAIAHYFKSQGVSMNSLKLGAYGQCCFGSANDVRGNNNYYRRAEIYFSHQLLLRHARMKGARKLVSDRRDKSMNHWN